MPELAAAGHRVVAVDLPCEDVSAGCREYAELVLQRLLDTADEDLVLVGHSAGGLTIPLIAAATPVTRMVFVSALLPRPGERLADRAARRRPHPDRLPRAAARRHPARPIKRGATANPRHARDSTHGLDRDFALPVGRVHQRRSNPTH